MRPFYNFRSGSSINRHSRERGIDECSFSTDFASINNAFKDSGYSSDVDNFGALSF